MTTTTTTKMTMTRRRKMTRRKRRRKRRRMRRRTSSPPQNQEADVCCVFDQIAMSARYCERLGMRIHWAWCVVRASPTYRQSRCRAAVRVAALVCERHRCNSAPLHHWTYIFTPRSHRPLADAFYPMCPPNEL
jgi:hypothetical protein